MLLFLLFKCVFKHFVYFVWNNIQLNKCEHFFVPGYNQASSYTTPNGEAAMVKNVIQNNAASASGASDVDKDL